MGAGIHHALQQGVVDSAMPLELERAVEGQAREIMAERRRLGAIFSAFRQLLALDTGPGNFKSSDFESGSREARQVVSCDQCARKPPGFRPHDHGQEEGERRLQTPACRSHAAEYRSAGRRCLRRRVRIA